MGQVKFLETIDHNFFNIKFREFAKAWDFVHTTSSPQYLQSNRLLEE